MSNPPDDPDSAGPRQRHVEVGVAAFMVLLGAITIIGSLQVGIGWGAEGPKSGFFPFWIGLIIVATSVFNLVRAYAKPQPQAVRRMGADRRRSSRWCCRWRSTSRRCRGSASISPRPC